MKTETRVARDFDQVGKNHLKAFQELLRQREIFAPLRDRLSEILGPLTVRERWEFFGSIGLERVREFVSLEGGSSIVASNILNHSFGEYTYPWNIKLVMGISQAVGLGQVEDVLRTYILELTQEQEKSG